jgi:hypothetical protein
MWRGATFTTKHDAGDGIATRSDIATRSASTKILFDVYMRMETRKVNKTL